MCRAPACHMPFPCRLLVPAVFVRDAGNLATPLTAPSVPHWHHRYMTLQLYQQQLGAEFNVETVAEGVAKLGGGEKSNATREAEPVGESTAIEGG